MTTRLSTIIGDPVGTIREFVAPPNADWARCDGTVVSKSTYPVLANVLPSLPFPEVRTEGSSIAADLKAVGDISGITFFINSVTGGWTNYARSHMEPTINAPQSADGQVWSTPVFRGNTMFVAAADMAGNPRVGFANVTGTFNNASVQSFLTNITPPTATAGWSGSWFSYGSSNEVIMRTDQNRAFAWRGSATPNTTNFVEVATSPTTNHRNSLIVTSNVAVAVSNTNVWLYKQPQFVSWNRSVNTSIAVSKCTWTSNNNFLFVANNANIYRATEAQVLAGSLGTAAAFAASADVLSIASAGSTVVVSGLGGLLGNSVDGGATFTACASATTNAIRCVALANSTHGVAVGDGGILRRTTDSGVSWSTVASPVGAFAFTQAVFTNGRFYACYQTTAGTPALIDSADGHSWSPTSGPRDGSFVQSFVGVFIEARRSSNSLVVFLDFPISESFELSGTTWTGPHKTGFSTPARDVSANDGPSQVVVVAHQLAWCTNASFQNWEWSLASPYHTSRDFTKTVETANGSVFLLNAAHTSVDGFTGRWAYTPDKLMWNRRQTLFPMVLVTPSGVVSAIVDRAPRTGTAGTWASSHIASSVDGGMSFTIGSTFYGEHILGLMNDGEVLYKFVIPYNSVAQTPTVSFSVDYGVTWAPVQASGLASLPQTTFYKQGQLLISALANTTFGQFVAIQTFNYDPATSMRLPLSRTNATDGSHSYVKVR